MEISPGPPQTLFSGFEGAGYTPSSPWSLALQPLVGSNGNAIFPILVNPSGITPGGGDVQWWYGEGGADGAGALNPSLEFLFAPNDVNWLQFQSSASASDLQIVAKGGGTSVGINLVTVGTGTVKVNGVAITPGAVSWPLTNATDESFQPTGIANNALT